MIVVRFCRLPCYAYFYFLNFTAPSIDALYEIVAINKRIFNYWYIYFSITWWFSVMDGIAHGISRKESYEYITIATNIIRISRWTISFDCKGHQSVSFICLATVARAVNVDKYIILTFLTTNSIFIYIYRVRSNRFKGVVMETLSSSDILKQLGRWRFCIVLYWNIFKAPLVGEPFRGTFSSEGQKKRNKFWGKKKKTRGYLLTFESE